MEHLPKLAGYWEIQEVVLPDGSKRDFTANTVIDYIELQGANGVRKKLSPSLNGRYLTTTSSETFFAIVDNGKLILEYSTAFDSWQEEILTAGDSIFTARNEDGKLYTYKRYVPLNLNDLP
jgi:hypothetical protein